MKLTLSILGPGLIKSASIREKTARMTELGNLLKSIGDHVANTGAVAGRTEHGDFRGVFSIEG